MVTFTMPYSVSGVTEHYYHGTGLVVDAQRGLVVVDRDTVPVSMGDVTVTFAGTVQVPGRVVYVNPLHNLAIVAYDPRLIGTTPVKSATAEAAEPGRGPADLGGGPGRRQPAALAGHTDRQHRPLVAAAVAHHALPRHQHRDHRAGESRPASTTACSPMPRADVLGMWSSFAYDTANGIAQALRGVPIDLVADMVDRVRSGRALHSLDAELFPQPLASARQMGLSQAWTARLAAHSHGAAGADGHTPGRRLAGVRAPACPATSCWRSTARWSPIFARSSARPRTARRCRSAYGGAGASIR